MSVSEKITVLNRVEDSEGKEGTIALSEQHPANTRTRFGLFLICGAILFCHMFATGIRNNTLSQYSYREFQRMVETTENASKADTYHRTDSVVLCAESTNSKLYNKQSEAQELTSQWNIYRSVIADATSILTTYVFGVLSDMYGRKPFIVIPIIGHFLRNLLYTIGIYLKIDIYVFLPFGITDFLFGPGEMVLASIFSIVADNTSADRNRSKVIAMMILASGTGLALSLVSGGYIIDAAGYMYPMMTSTMILLPAVVLSFSISETYENKTVSSADGKEKFSKKLINQFRGIYEFYTKDSSVLAKRWKYIVCMLAFLFTQIVNAGIINVEFLFTFNTPLCWNSVKLGWYGLAEVVTLQIVSMVIFPFIQRCITDETINVISSVSSAVSLIYEAFAVNDVMMFIVPVIAAVCYLFVPTIKAIMSNMTPSDKQGTLFASQAIVEKVCVLLGSTVVNGIYGATVGIYRGFAFFVLAAFNMIAAALVGYYIHRTKREPEKDLTEIKDKSEYLNVL